MKWQPAEIAKRLKIPEPGAKQLLTALGYEYHNGISAWIPGQSRQARKRRKRWKKAESEMFRRQGL